MLKVSFITQLTARESEMFIISPVICLYLTSPLLDLSLSFLFRCGSKQGEEDYRPLFENFVQDLLSTVNKPEWPAAELLLSLLGRLLVSVALCPHI